MIHTIFMLKTLSDCSRLERKHLHLLCCFDSFIQIFNSMQLGKLLKEKNAEIKKMQQILA